MAGGNRTAPNLGLKYEHSAGPESFDSGDVGDLEWRLIPDTATTIEKSPHTLRKTYGPGFAAGRKHDEKLSDVLHKLDEASLSQLMRRGRTPRTDLSSGVIALVNRVVREAAGGHSR